MASSMNKSEPTLLKWCVTSASVTIVANKCESLLKDLYHRYFVERPKDLKDILSKKEKALNKYNMVNSIWNGKGIGHSQRESKEICKFATRVQSTLHELADSFQKTLASKSEEETPEFDTLLEISEVVDSNTENEVDQFNRFCSEFSELSISDPITLRLKVAASRELVSGKEIMNENLTLNRGIRQIFFNQQAKRRELGDAPTEYNRDADIITWLKETRGLTDETLEKAFKELKTIDDVRVNFHHVITETRTADEDQFQELCESFEWIAYQSGLFEAAYDGMSPAETKDEWLKILNVSHYNYLIVIGVLESEISLHLASGNLEAVKETQQAKRKIEESIGRNDTRVKIVRRL